MYQLGAFENSPNKTAHYSLSKNKANIVQKIQQIRIEIASKCQGIVFIHPLCEKYFYLQENLYDADTHYIICYSYKDKFEHLVPTINNDSLSFESNIPYPKYKKFLEMIYPKIKERADFNFIESRTKAIFELIELGFDVDYYNFDEILKSHLKE